MKKSHVLLCLVLVGLAMLTLSCSGPKPPKKVIIAQPPVQGQPPQGGAQIANPASENCVNKGGQLVILKRGDGGEYGVCIFQDNMQCEEWAMFRGDCPVGGIKITGYITDAAIYCAITGGEYTITAQSNTQEEQGVCAFKNGKSCDVWEYYNGTCLP